MKKAGLKKTAGREKPSRAETGPPGKVFLVGAGPGHPGYVTLRAIEALRCADVVVYDNLVSDAVLNHAPAAAVKLYAGKRPGKHSMPQDRISALLVTLARKHQKVVRLKGGDPLIFGRGAEEAEELAAAGIPFEIVPGITAAQGASACAGIPLTRRGFNESLTLATGHEDPSKGGSTLDYGALAKAEHLVFYMGIARIESICGRLMENGLSPETPAAVVRNAGMPDQRSVRAPLGEIAAAVRRNGITAPALLFIGPNASQGLMLDWFENRPLFGKTVVVTRSRAQASDLRAALEELGAAVVEFPVIKIEPVSGAELRKVDKAVRSLEKWDWILFSSVNGVDLFRERLECAGLDSRAFGGLKIGAIGPATAARLETMGIKPDFMPAKYTTKCFAAELPAARIGRGVKILLARARLGEPELASTLKKSGASVTDLPLYDTLPERGGEKEIRKLLKDKAASAVTFTSSSTVRNFRDRVGSRNFLEFSKKAIFASIGPATSRQIRDFGCEPGVEASEHTIPGLVRALAERLAAEKKEGKL